MTIPMPEPVAWVRRHPDGALTAEFLEDAVISPTRQQSGAWLPMITTAQAEAYADARVREVLEKLEQACIDADYISEVDRAIRALMPPLSGPVEP